MHKRPLTAATSSLIKPYDITTEPGAQFEMSIQAQSDISELDRLYREFMVEVLPTFEAKDQRLAAMGYHPVTKIDGITILPKKRYDYMYNYFKKHGTMSHNMMNALCPSSNHRLYRRGGLCEKVQAWFGNFAYTLRYL